MAFISLGSKSFGSSPTITAKFSYEKRRDGADMEYRVKIILSPLTGSHYYGYPISAKVSLAGSLKVTKQLKAASPSQWSSDIEYTTSWYTVSKKTTGTTSLSVRLYATSGGTRDSTYNFSLAIDPAASVLGSISNFTIGNAINIPITKYSSGFTDSLTISVAGTTIKTINNISNGYDVRFSSTELTNIYKKIPSSTTATFTFKLTTKSGSTTVGTSTKTVTGTIPSSVKPSISSVSISEAGSIPSSWGVYVKNKSKIKFVISASAGSGSSISSVKTTFNGSSYTGTTITTNTITASGTLTATITATDKRGRTTSTTKSVSVLNYQLPYITSLTAFRCNSDGTANSKGTYMKISLIGGVTSLSGKNTYRYKIEYKKSTISTYTVVNITGQDQTCSYSKIIAIESNSNYDVRATVSDHFSNITIKAPPIPSIFRTISLRPGGQGIAFGKYATVNGIVDFGLSIVCNDSTNKTEIRRIGRNSNWWNGRDNAIIALSQVTGYNPVVSMKTADGSWQIGVYNHAVYPNEIMFAYTNDIDYSNGTNGTQRVFRFNPEGELKGFNVFNPVFRNSYWGIEEVANKEISYIRTPKSGIIPYQPSGNTSYVGTPGWRFTYGYFANLHATNLYLDTDYAYIYTNDTHVRLNGGALSFRAPYTKSDAVINCMWSDNAVHNIVQRESSNRVNFGPADIGLSTICALRGKTVRIYNHKGGAVYLGNSGSTAVTSDENVKDIYELDERYVEFFKNIKPIKYKYKKVGHRYHMGFGARQIEQSLLSAGLTTEEFAGVLKDTNISISADEAQTDEDVYYDELYSLRYEEFIALNTMMVQKAFNKVAILEKELKELKGE